MIDNAIMAQLWTKVRSAVLEFRISRMQRKSDTRFRVIVKYRRRAFRTTGHRGSSRRASLAGRQLFSTRYSELKRVLHRKAGLVAAAAVNFKGSANSPKADWGFTAEDGSRDSEDTLPSAGGILLSEENEERLALVVSRWNEMELGSISPRRSQTDDFSAVTPPSRSFRWEDLGSSSRGWESTMLASTMSVSRPAFQPAESSSRSNFSYHRWDNLDWRLSYRSAQLVQPVRGKLTTLSSLMKTMSDRYARRTGKLTPLHERASKQRLLTQSLSAPWTPQQQHKFSSGNSTTCTAKSVDLSAKRYDNPFQEFLRRSYLEKHTKFAQQYMLRNGEGNRWSIG